MRYLLFCLILMMSGCAMTPYQQQAGQRFFDDVGDIGGRGNTTRTYMVQRPMSFPEYVTVTEID